MKLPQKGWEFMMKLYIALVMSVFLLVSSFAQQVEEELTVILRESRVHVVNSKGIPVTGLKKSDFVVFQDKELQKIDYFEEVDLFAEETGLRQAPPPGNFAYSHQTDPRYLVLVLDSSNMSLRSFKKFRDAAVDFVRNTLHDNDVVKIVQIDSGMMHLSEFTSDRSRLVQALKNAEYTGRMFKEMMILERGIVEGVFDYMDGEELDAVRQQRANDINNAVGQQPTSQGPGLASMYVRQINEYVDRKARLKANHFRTFYLNMLSLGQILKPITGSKSIMLLTGGAYLENAGNYPDTQLMAEKMARVFNSNNITMYNLLNKPTVPMSRTILNMGDNPLENRNASGPIIDPQSLMTASQFPPEIANAEFTQNTVLENDFQIESGPTFTAEATGGFFEITSWVKEIDNSMEALLFNASQYYRLAYTTNVNTKRVKLKIKLREELRDQGYKLRYGEFFDAPKPFSELNEEERALDFESTLLYSRSFRNDLSARWSYDFFHGSTGGYRIPVYVEVPKQAFPKDGYELGFALLGENYEIIDLTRSEILSNPANSDLLFYDVMMSRALPKYIRYHLRNKSNGYTSFEEVTIDEFEEERPDRYLSPIALAAVDNTKMVAVNHFREGSERELKRRAEDPFHLGDSLYKPDVDRAFGTGEALGFFFHLYDAPQPADAYSIELSIFNEGTPVKIQGSLNKVHTVGANTHHYYGMLDTRALESGEFQLKLKVTDNHTGSTFEREKSFRIAAK
jgi:VWFA-related protein